MAFVSSYLQYKRRLKSKGTVVLGSSSGEIFDYLFGDNPLYHPFWISGWSARGLRNERTQNYISHILSSIDRDALILLCFGPADVFFNLAYKRQKGELISPQQFSSEMVDGLVATKTTLNQLGFSKVLNILYNPVPHFENNYWSDIGIENQLQTHEMAHVLKVIADMCSKRIETLNLIPLFSTDKNSYIASSAYQRVVDDHHLDYIKIQKKFWRFVRDAQGILPRKKKYHKLLYEHIPSDIEPLVSSGKTRTRTCRG